MRVSKRPVRLTRQLVIIIIALVVLSSIPNIGHVMTENICASKACYGVKLQNPIMLPYSWLLVEKKCKYCTLDQNFLAVAYSHNFPAVLLMNLVISLAYLMILSLLIDYLVSFTRERLNGPAGNRTQVRSSSQPFSVKSFPKRVTASSHSLRGFLVKFFSKKTVR